MDQHSEVEAKFDAAHLTPGAIHKALDDDGTAEKVRSYKRVGGWDRYYEQGGRFLRHRCDGMRKTSVLTVKERKSSSSIQDRHEVDMPIAEQVPADDVTAFLTMTGWKLHFEISKMSYIWHFQASDYVACIALYDVWQGHKATARRFLEIEIEKDSNCTHAAAKTILEGWITWARQALRLDVPLNESLFEIYAPKTLTPPNLVQKLVETVDGASRIDCDKSGCLGKWPYKGICQCT